MSSEKVVRLVPRNPAGLVPPHDLDAEAVCLEALATRADRRDELLAILQQEHFYSDANGLVFQAIASLSEAGKAIDEVSICTWLHDREKDRLAGSPAYVHQIIYTTPSVHHVEQHARVVVDKWRLRQFIAKCQQYAAEGYGDVGDVDRFIGGAASDLDALAQGHDTDQVEPIGPAARAAYKSILDSTKRSGMMGLSTGLRSLDRKLGGLRAGRVTVIGARASMGKTALARTILSAMPDQAVAAAMFSMEMTREELAAAWVFTHARVNGEKLKEHGTLNDEEWRRLTGSVEELGALPIWVDDTPGLSLRKIRVKIRQIKASAKRRGLTLGIVAIDYLQLMDGSEGLTRGSNREEAVAKLSREIKVMAGELGVHVLLLSQINRGPEGRQVSNRRPTMAELRESGAIENDADNVILVYRDEYYHPDTKDAGIAELILAKQRSGRRNVTVRVAFTAWCTRFDDLAYEDPPEGYE